MRPAVVAMFVKRAEQLTTRLVATCPVRSIAVIQCTRDQSQRLQPDPVSIALVRPNLPAGQGASGLTYFNEVAVGIAHITTDLVAAVLGFGEELRALSAPFAVGLLDVRYPDL